MDEKLEEIPGIPSPMSDTKPGADLVREPLVTAAHIVYPYTQASISASYINTNEVLVGHYAGYPRAIASFNMGSTAHLEVKFAFARDNKPPDIPIFLSQLEHRGVLVLLSSEVSPHAPTLDTASGTYTYSCEGNMRYLVTDPANPAIQTFMYPRSPIDGSLEFPEVGFMHFYSSSPFKSTVYYWLGASMATLETEPATPVEELGYDAYMDAFVRELLRLEEEKKAEEEAKAKAKEEEKEEEE